MDKPPLIEVSTDSIEALAENIEIISSSFEKMMSSGLTEETIVLLLHDHSRVGKRDIKNVLRSLGSLNYYLKEQDK